MARKNDFISELYNRTCKTVVANPESWEAFLRSACYNYRLRFDEQLLVHAQRPDATAVLQIDDWNQKFGRWVNRGAHGIAVFEDADQRRQRLVHYFDISDTHPSRFFRRVPIWQMRDEYTAEVIDTLESTFGELNDKETLAVAIESAAKNAVEDNIPDYLSDLIYSVKDSFLDGVSEEEITHIFKTAVRNSVAYMTMTRLGIEAGEYFEPDDLRDVVNFTTPATLNALGYATSDIAEMGLAEISRTILALDRQNRIIAEKTKADYNVGKEKTERSPDDERDHLHEAGGLSAPRSDNAGAAGAVDGQVRPDAEEVPEGASQGTLLQPADELRPERASERHGAQSEGAGTDADGADGSVGGRDGESESDGYDELGSEDEQYPEPSSGDRDGGGNLRLDYYDRRNEDKSLPFFGGDDTIREILGTTPHLKASKDEIRAFFEATADENARISYIKRIFNNDYTEVILRDGRCVGYKTYQNVLQLWEGSYLSRTAQSFYDWGVIAQHFETMRLLGELQDTMKPLPSIDGQLSLMTAGAEERKPSAFTFSQEIIDAVLTRGSGISEGKMRIYDQFQKSLSAKENADFLKNEYGWGGVYPAIVGAGVDEQLDEAVSNIHGELTVYEVEVELDEEDNSIPADPTVRNFSYTVLDDKIYFRENSRMAPVEVSATAENRIKGMIRIRDSVRRLIELQTEDYPDSEIKTEQGRLNALYDTFSKQYGLINSRANISAFSQDSSFSLLSALEVLGDEGQLERKADMFYKRTIKPHTPVTSVDTASEALAVSMGEKARVDMEYMCELTGKTEKEIFADLKGVIFLNPLYGYGDVTQTKYLMADEYLSGNVREKLAIAKKSAQLYPEDYTVNVEALERVQPKDLTASEIAVRLGATWLPSDIVEQFMFEFLGTPRYTQWNIKIHFSAYTGEWNIEGKSYDRSNVKAYSTYGTERINAYKIIEETLNLKDVRIFDYVEDADGKKKAVLNKRETAIAQAKQELIKQGFQDWVWSDPERRERLCRLYNDKFNSLRPREYDGSHIVFSGMNPEIELREHQRNAVAHILYGGNTLLAHTVGAGKTFEMVAAAMEAKRLGLCTKSLFVVPNHLTEQWASEFLQLYPSANILVATKKDFETKNRKKFCGRIATGDYDAIIIGHTQFEKIPMSIERQRAILEQQLDEVTEGIAELKKNRGDNFSVKQLERTKKAVRQKLDKLNDQSKKDDVVTFEELGVDRLFIDESHYYKNLFLYTKMRNVGGIAQTEAMKSSDLFMKCRYLDELTGGRGTVFATGTPISNSMVELYTIQRYLQYNTLVQNNLQHFDAWASTFGETITAVELTPEGTGYRAKTRFARFYNLPELMAMFKEIADIKTADMLDLPVPKAVYLNISVKPSEIQKQMVAELAERAERVRNGMVDAKEDNMLKITNDGRKLALDQRLINPLLPDFEDSKLNACVDAMFETWERGSEKRLTQLFFCDLSTPKNDGSFNVYDDIRQKLIARGVPADEIKFIHEADTEAKKLELFKKVRRGDVRILMGSTQKMGAGTNVQNKLAASSDLDCPWRPSDLEQRLGRSIRQGNENAEVHIYRFVTEETFDAYLYQLVEGKQKFASQIMTSKSPVRSCEDIDETALSYAEIKMLATGNPHIKEKMDLDIQVQKLRLLKSSFLSEKYALEDKIIKFYPQEIARRTDVIAGLKSDMERVAEHPKPSDETFVGMTVKGAFYSEKADAGNAILEACKAMTNPEPIPLGEYRGFTMELYFEAREYKVRLKGELGYPVTLGTDTFGNITRLDNALEGLLKRLEMNEMELDNTKKQFETAKVDVERPFPQEEELKAKTDRLNELNALLNVDKRENEIVGGEPDEGEELPEKKPRDLGR
ncbi:MAG: hypothetical protein EGQ01_13985 [Ruminococcaceae bacterium]|nr:hypothetical protein [Oscillospiraceae bacterium]